MVMWERRAKFKNQKLDKCVETIDLLPKSMLIW